MAERADAVQRVPQSFHLRVLEPELQRGLQERTRLASVLETLGKSVQSYESIEG